MEIIFLIFPFVLFFVVIYAGIKGFQNLSNPNINDYTAINLSETRNKLTEVEGKYKLNSVDFSQIKNISGISQQQNNEFGSFGESMIVIPDNYNEPAILAISNYRIVRDAFNLVPLDIFCSATSVKMNNEYYSIVFDKLTINYYKNTELLATHIIDKNNITGTFEIIDANKKTILWVKRNPYILFETYVYAISRVYKNNANIELNNMATQSFFYSDNSYETVIASYSRGFGRFGSKSNYSRALGKSSEDAKLTTIDYIASNLDEKTKIIILLMMIFDKTCTL